MKRSDVLEMDDERNELKPETKRTMGQRVIFSIFRGGDFKTFCGEFWDDQVKPLLANTLEDLTSSAIRAIFDSDDDFDDDRYRNYNGRSKKKRRRNKDKDKGRRRRDRDRDYDDDDDEIPTDLGPNEMHIVGFSSRRKAMDVIDAMCYLWEDQKYITAADFYSEAGVITTNFQNDKWGLDEIRDIRRADIRQKGGKYHVYFPKFIRLED